MTSFEIYKVPGDGECCFRCISIALQRAGYEKYSTRELRKLCIRTVINHPSMKLSQMTIKEWFKLTEWKCVCQYEREMMKAYGSAFELAIFAQIFSMEINVWVPDDKEEEEGLKKISQFIPYNENQSKSFSSNPERVIHLLWTGNHYDLLIYHSGKSSR